AENNTLGPNISASNNSQMGVNVDGVLTRGNLLKGVVSSDNPGDGIRVGGYASFNTLSDCTVERNQGAGVNLAFAPDTTIEGCTITGHSSANDFLIASYAWCPRVTLNANTLKTTGSGGGIFLREADACSVVGNRVSGTFDKYGSAISLQRST